MNIVILDGYSVNHGDLSWDPLRKLGDLAVHDRTPPDLVPGRLARTPIALTNKVVLSREVLDELTDLRYIGVLATGYNVVDIEAAHDRGIAVTNVPAYGTSSVVPMVFAHLLNLTLRVGHHDRAVHEGRWAASADFCFWDYPLIELAGLTMGIVGVGRIGRAVADVARAFGMNVIACDPSPPAALPDGVAMVSLDRLFRESDVVTLHCPLTPQTRCLVNEERLASMKKTAYLINTSRGPVVDEKALAAALNADRLAGAGLDVLSTEPPSPDNPLLTARNCSLSPHIAWATVAARRRLLAEAVENIRAFLAGRPRNVVNP
jgi:glycerate dehydrogenase